MIRILLIGHLIIAAVCAVGDYGETGLMRLPFGSGVDCPDTIRFKCVTTGPGSTLLMLGGVELFKFSHPEYKNGSTINVSRLDGDITAGNLSESICSNMTDTCYTAYAVVRDTEQTSCLVITCNTTFRNGSDVTETFFGEATIVRSEPSVPSNLRKESPSSSSVMFAWDPGTPTCTNANYSVSIANCGACDRDGYIDRTDVTCDQLEPGQQLQCVVTVQSVLECGGLSTPLTRTFEVLIPISETENEAAGAGANVGGIVGGTVGGVGVIVGVVVILIVIVIVIWRKKRGKDSSNGKSNKQEDIEMGPEELLHSESGDGNNQEPVIPPEANESTGEGHILGDSENVPLLSPPRPPPHTGGSDASGTEPEEPSRSESGAGPHGNNEQSVIQPEADESIDQGRVDSRDNEPAPQPPQTGGSDAPGTEPEEPSRSESGAGPHGNDPEPVIQPEETNQLSASSSGAEATPTDTGLHHTGAHVDPQHDDASQESKKSSVVTEASEDNAGVMSRMSIPSPRANFQPSGATRSGLPTIPRDFGEQMEIGGETNQKAGVQSEPNSHPPKNMSTLTEEVKGTSQNVDAEDQNSPASGALGGLPKSSVFIAGEKGFSNGAGSRELDDLKTLIEEQGKELNEQIEKQGKEFDRKLKEEINVVREENTSNIKILTEEIDGLKAEVERLTEELREKNKDNTELRRKLKKAQKELVEKDRQLQEALRKIEKLEREK